MHELGIVFHIIDSIEEVGRQSKLRRVSTVTLELGEVSGVVHTYLAVSYTHLDVYKRQGEGGRDHRIQ